MSPIEAQLVEVSQRFALLGMQVTTAFQAEQDKLGVDQVLAPARLQSAEATELSLLALERLKALTAAHREAFQKFMVNFSEQLTAVMATLPAEGRREHHTRWAGTAQWHMDAQARFYDLRERWIAAAAEVCELIQSRRGSASFSATGIQFPNAEDVARLQQLLARISQLRQDEDALMTERLHRLASMSGTPPSPAGVA